MKNQTAVEWLHNQWANEREWTWEKIESWFEQALAMERGQIKLAHLVGLMTDLKEDGAEQAKDYYNKTYK